MRGCDSGKRANRTNCAIENFFKLEEEGNAALLLHLPKLFAEAAVFGSASGFCCRLVVAIAQATVYEASRV
jgi:hypothetical protein